MLLKVGVAVRTNIGGFGVEEKINRVVRVRGGGRVLGSVKSKEDWVRSCCMAEVCVRVSTSGLGGCGLEGMSCRWKNA